MWLSVWSELPCTLENVGTISSYQTLNMILINATLLLVHFLLCLNFMSLFYVQYVYVLYELFISSIVLCALLSYVNTCTCHVYFTINLLTCCLHMVQLMPLPSQNQPVIPVVVLLTLLVLYVAGSVNGTVSVRLSVPSCYSVRQVCCCKSCGREILTAVDAAARRSAAH